MLSKNIAFRQILAQTQQDNLWLQIDRIKEEISADAVSNIIFQREYPAEYELFCLNNEVALKKAYAEYCSMQSGRAVNYEEFQKLMSKRYFLQGTETLINNKESAAIIADALLMLTENFSLSFRELIQRFDKTQLPLTVQLAIDCLEKINDNIYPPNYSYSQPDANVQDYRQIGEIKEIIRTYVGVSNATAVDNKPFEDILKTMLTKVSAETRIAVLEESDQLFKGWFTPVEIARLFELVMNETGNVNVEFYNLLRQQFGQDVLQEILSFADLYGLIDKFGYLKMMGAVLDVGRFLPSVKPIINKIPAEQKGHFLDFIKIILKEQGYSLYILAEAKDFFKNNLSQAEIDDLNRLYNSFFAESPTKEYYVLLSDLIGKDKLQNILLKHIRSLENAHDNLLFMEKIKMLSRKDQKKMVRLVLIPILTAGYYGTEFNKLLNSFDVSEYINYKNGKEVPFRDLMDFRTEVERQRLKVEVPLNSSIIFQDAVRTLLKAPGIDLAFIKQFIDNYQNPTDAFSATLINYIEHKDNIDEHQLIKPFSVTLPFDSLYKLVYTAIGVRDLNNLTPKYIKHFEDAANLGQLIAVLRTADEQTKAFLLRKRDAAMAADPANKQKYIMDYQKALRSNLILKMGGNNTVVGLNRNILADLHLWLSTTEQRQVADILAQALRNDSQLLETVQATLAVFHERRETLFNSVDLLEFRNILDSVNKLYQCGDFSADAILTQFENNILGLAGLLIYLGFNNKQRQTTSQPLKTELDRVLKQEKYLEQSVRLDQDRAEANVFNQYLNGQIILDAADEEQVRAILIRYGYVNVGRKLKVEICRKSDPRGWVCGDYTDCCMTFTTSKNRQYIVREDIAYFIVSIVDAEQTEDIVMQSVLVAATEDTIAIDNIEIAKRAMEYRHALVSAYDILKEKLGDKMLVIGTAYNDDEGLITADLELKPRLARPLHGIMEYSDWAKRSTNYVFNDPRSTINPQAQKYYGLSIDMLGKSPVRLFVADRAEISVIKELLREINRGETDKGGRVIFPDNYSCVVVKDGQILGYIVAANYVAKSNIANLVVFEKVRLTGEQAFIDYLDARVLEQNKDLGGILLKQAVLAESPYVRELLQEYYGDRVALETKENGDLVLEFKKR